MVGRTLPRVLDFGIARIAHQREAGDLMAGSPFYMAPEQVERRETDRRTDVFSLGVVLYELLTGERPFQGQTLKDITDAVCTAVPTPAHLRQPEVPVGLSEIAARAMEKDPAERYSSARALSRELRHWLDAHPQALNAAEETPRRASRFRATAAAGLGLALTAAVAWMAWSAPAPARSLQPGLSLFAGSRPPHPAAGSGLRPAGTGRAHVGGAGSSPPRGAGAGGGARALPGTGPAQATACRPEGGGQARPSRGGCGRTSLSQRRAR